MQAMPLPKTRKRPRLGDLVLVTTPAGSALAHYTHKHADYGALLRVLGPAPAGFSEGMDLETVAARPPQFLTFFPLGAACARGIARIIGHAPIPPQAEAFPTFRTGFGRPGQSRVWWLWDGTKEWRVGMLTPEQAHLPIREIINDTLLVERAISGWQSGHEV